MEPSLPEPLSQMMHVWVSISKEDSGGFLQLRSPGTDVMLFHVHKRKSCQSHTGVEVKRSISDPLLSASIDWLAAEWLAVICIRVVLLYSKRNWMICKCVFSNKVSFFIWEQWDHVEAMCDDKEIFKRNCGEEKDIKL